VIFFCLCFPATGSGLKQERVWMKTLFFPAPPEFVKNYVYEESSCPSTKNEIVIKIKGCIVSGF